MKGDTYKETIHEGSVSYPVIRVAPPPGQGKHAKTPKQLQRRAWCSAFARKLKSAGIRNAYALARAFVYGDVYTHAARPIVFTDIFKAPISGSAQTRDLLRHKMLINSAYGAMVGATHRMTVKER